MFRSATNVSSISIALVLCFCYSSFISAEAVVHHGSEGNVTIKWDVINWTPDGYVAVVTIFNYQNHRRIEAPGWQLGWTWAKKEVIWSMVGGQTTYQGDCSKFKGNIPHSCKKSPVVVDLGPKTPYNQRIDNCCKGGVLTSFLQDKVKSQSSFQISVGEAGTTSKTIKLPMKFTFKAPGSRYYCGPARVVKNTLFITPDRRRTTQALKTWKVTCSYTG